MAAKVLSRFHATLRKLPIQRPTHLQWVTRTWALFKNSLFEILTLCSSLFLSGTGDIVARDEGLIDSFPVHYPGQDILDVMTKVQIVELAALIQTEHESDVLGRLMATGMQPVERKQVLTVNAKLAVFLFLICAGVLSLLQNLMVITFTQQGLRFAPPPAYCWSRLWRYPCLSS